jgi:hypothetical protein
MKSPVLAKQSPYTNLENEMRRSEESADKSGVSAIHILNI